MIKKTAQTKFIYDFVKSTKRHPSAEEIFDFASKNLPYITRATVYNVLKRLVDAGEVRELHIKKGLTVYDGNVIPHPHLKCSSCGRIEDIEIPDFEKFLESIWKQYPGSQVDVVISDLCSKCKNLKEGGVF